MNLRNVCIGMCVCLCISTGIGCGSKVLMPSFLHQRECPCIQLNHPTAQAPYAAIDCDRGPCEERCDCSAFPEAGPLIDVLSYMAKANTATGLGSTSGFVWHQIPMNQNIVNDGFYLEKWFSPTTAVHYLYDNVNIYMTVDTTDVYPYKFDPGVWAKRQMSVGETVNMSANRIQLLDHTCHVTQSEASFPYFNVLEAHYPQFELGGDLGVQDVIVLAYYWGAPDFTNVEREYYAKGYGIVKWDWHYRRVPLQSVTTNMIVNRIPTSVEPMCYDLHDNFRDLTTPPLFH